VVELDQQLQAWRNRPLGCYTYLWLDARYEKVRVDGIVRDTAVLMTVGLNLDSKREVLGVSNSLSEAEIHWRSFLESLTQRGLASIELITSDDHAGLEKARKAVFGGVPWQRCQFHLQQNTQAYVPRRALNSEVAAEFRAVFNARDRPDAEELLALAVEKYAKTASGLADWMEENISEGLTIFSFPEKHRRRLRTTNGLERLNREIRRRTRVAVLFPNTDSCLRLVTAIVMEISEEWQTGYIYIRLDNDF
jgi:putative transposase